MAMNLSKAQLQHIAYEIKNELANIGKDRYDDVAAKAKEQFINSADGRTLMRLRAKYDQKYLGNDLLDKVAERAAKSLPPKPFNGYLSTNDLERAVAMHSMDAQTGQDVIDAVKREWYKKLKPAVRKAWGLSVR